MKIAFSTVVCPGWTLDEVIKTASDLGYLGVEMRTFTEPDPAMVCDPMLMDAGAVRRAFKNAGVEAVGLATGIRYDKPIFPPVVGRILVNGEEGVADTKACVEFADNASAKYVRVYGFELPAIEPHAWGLRRVGERLQLAAQTCRNTDTRLLIENGGSFARASDLLELIEAYPNQWLGVSYNIKAAKLAGECPVEGVKMLKKYLHCVKIVDVDEENNPVMLGDGVLPCREVISELDDMGFAGWIVYEYPKLWVSEDGRDPREVLEHACSTLYNWVQDADFECSSDCGCDMAGA